LVLEVFLPYIPLFIRHDTVGQALIDKENRERNSPVSRKHAVDYVVNLGKFEVKSRDITAIAPDLKEATECLASPFRKRYYI